MKAICRELRERLAEQGAQALREDVAAQRHLEECADCFGALEGLARLDAALQEIGTVDAPDAVVGELLERVRAEGRAPARRPLVSRPVLWSLASAAAVLLVVVATTPSLLRARRSAPRPAPQRALHSAAREDAPVPAVEPERKLEEKEAPLRERKDELPREAADNLKALGYVQDAGKRPEAASGADRADRKTEAVESGLATQSPLEKKKTQGGETGARENRQAKELDDGSLVAGNEQAQGLGGTLATPPLIHRVEPVYPEQAREAGVEGVVIVEVRVDATGKVETARVLRGIPLLNDAALEAVKQWVYAPTLLGGKAVPVYFNVSVLFRLPEPEPSPGSSDLGASDPARAFLEERSATEGLAFQPAQGYWANTYVPGDPALRLLQARLAAWDPSSLHSRTGAPLRLHQAAAQPSQPFDAPAGPALAVYVSADRRGLEGPARMLVQVGLQGAARSGGRRTAQSLALVLDLRGSLDVETAARMRALALALARAREAGDRFSLVVAGRPGGVVVPAAELRNGPLTVALDRLLSDDAQGAGLDLAEALATAYREATRCDDPEAVLGSSAVVLATGQALEQAGTLADLAHQGALAGIPLSVVSVGGGASLREIDGLVLAGQGRRRLLDSPADAPRVVDSELAAAGAAVARAVRLRIRLAPGVRLVDVVGSRRLDEAQAERVRQIERRIDLDLARKLGIAEDRGEDEDGIQIVIPSFQAGDAHAILLDVVASGPGRIADVSVRYKDLLSPGNAVARASLALPRASANPGPLERNVLANLLAFRVSRALDCAGDALAAGEVPGAATPIEQARALLEGIGARLPGFAGDPGLSRDAAMLREYADLLASGALGPDDRPRVADSLHYAARLKLLPRPASLAATL